jgi:hypothetical protein
LSPLFTRKKLLTNILDPDREIPPNYLAYVVEAHGGASYTGLTVIKRNRWQRDRGSEKRFQ